MRQCHLCGKFKKDCETRVMQSEGDEVWNECVECMSQFDLKLHAKAIQYELEDLKKRAKILEDALEAKTKRSNYQWSSGSSYTPDDFENEGSIKCALEVLAEFRKG